MTNTQKALELINTIAKGDREKATSLLAEREIQHNKGIAEHCDLMEKIADKSTWQKEKANVNKNRNVNAPEP